MFFVSTITLVLLGCILLVSVRILSWKNRQAERDVLLKHAELLGIDTQKTQPIGEWTGFRPYRPTSRCEIDEKYDGIDEDVRIVHNYGYGGSGWTVYTGCAKEAADLVLR